VYCLELFDKELSGIVSIGKESSLDELMKIAESMYPQLESLLEDMIDYLDRKYIQVALDFDGNVYEEIGYNKTDTTDKARAYLLRMRTHIDDLYRFRKWEFTQFLSVIREAIPDDLRWEAMCDELTKMLEVYF
jgi:myosin-crossreactive antigen